MNAQVPLHIKKYNTLQAIIFESQPIVMSCVSCFLSFSGAIATPAAVGTALAKWLFYNPKGQK